MSAIFRDPDGGDELPFLRDMPFAPDAGLLSTANCTGEHLRGAITNWTPAARHTPAFDAHTGRYAGRFAQHRPERL
ncbi:MAG: hypothetical protein U0694_15775 [Anaerolineae bacterium]